MSRPLHCSLVAFPIPFIWPSRVRFVDTDASGRIHYTAMLRHFEAAEAEFLRALGFAYSVVDTSVIDYPRVHVECDYTAVVKDDDLLHIAVAVERVGNSSYTLGFGASAEGRPVAHGRITIVCMDKQTGRSRPLPETLSSTLKNRLAEGKR